MKTKHIILILALFNFSAVFAQIARDQDLVTLKNGYQVLGYIVEQQPGKLIKIYRPNQNDTMSVNMEDIDKISKIMVQTFSEKKREKKDTTIRIGRFNNKKNVFQFSYMFFMSLNYDVRNELLLFNDQNALFLQGGSIAYYRSLKNIYFPGLAVSYCGSKKYQTTRSSSYDSIYSYTDITNSFFQIMFENKFRICLGNPQNHRVTTLIGLNVGYVFDNSYYHYVSVGGKYKSDSYTEQSNGNFILQATFNLKVNPDNNSGFILEPGYAYYNPVIYQFQNHKESSTYSLTTHLGNIKGNYHLFTFRLSYFF